METVKSSVYVAFEAARAQALNRANVLNRVFYVLGPDPVEGYWIASVQSHRHLWKDRKPLFTARPERSARSRGRTRDRLEQQS